MKLVKSREHGLRGRRSWFQTGAGQGAVGPGDFMCDRGSSQGMGVDQIPSYAKTTSPGPGS